MATTVTLVPTSTVQAGTGTTVTGAASAHLALADSNDATTVRIAGRRRVGAEPCVVAFTAPSLPAGSQVINVALLRRVKSVVTGQTKPRAGHALRCLGDAPTSDVGGATQTTTRPLRRDYLAADLPQSTVATWMDEVVYSTPRGPDGKPWDVAGNLASLSTELGREDTAASAMDVAKLTLEVTYQQQSTIVLTAPTGTVTDTCRPTVGWAYASPAPDSEPQAKYRVVVYSQAQKDSVGFVAFQTTPTVDSGWLIGEASTWTLTDDLVNGVWWAYVAGLAKFDGPVEFPTTTSSISWTQSMVGAPNATLQSAVYDAAGNYVRLTFLPSSASPTTHAFAVRVSRDQGYTWGPVRGGLMRLATGMTPIALDDHQFELNYPSRYRVLAYGTSGAVLIPAADYSTEIDVTAVSETWWLLDPQNPLDKIPLPVMDGADTVTYEQVMGVFKPATGRGVRPKFVVRGVTYTPDGDLVLMFSREDPQAETYWQTYRRMIANGRTLLLQNPSKQDPTSSNLYVHLGPKPGGGEPETVTYRAPGGRTIRYRRVTVGYVSTSAPPITE